MSLSARGPIALLLALATLAPPLDASAATVVEKGRTEVQVGGFGRARLVGQTGDETIDQVGMNAVMARVMARGIHHDLGSLEVETDFTNASPLLDLIIDVNLGSPVGVKAGRFKVPFSREQLMAIPSLPTYDRTYLTKVFAPRRRVGIDAYAKLPASWGFIGVDAALFNPDNALTMSGEGMLAVGRLNVGFNFGLEVHVAYMEHIFGDTVDPRQPSGDFVFPFDGQIDAALLFERAGVRALAETIIVTNAIRGGSPFGLYGMLAYQIGGEPGSYGYEPAIGVDYIDLDDDSTTTRVMANFHWLIQQRQLQASLGYGAELVTDQDTGHRFLFELQGGF